MEKLQWGFIGCGNVTEVKSGPAFWQPGVSTVAAVMRRNRQLAMEYAARFGVGRYYDDAYTMLDERAANAIYIATPPGSHEEYALAAIARGYPVYIEKPVGADAAAAHRIANAVSESGVKASVAHYRRRLRPFTCVRELLQEGFIGKVHAIQLRLWKHVSLEQAGWRVDPAQSGGGIFHDLAPHQLDIMLWLFGMPQACNGMSTGPDPRIAQTVSGQILFENDILFNGSWDFNVPEEETADECIITGSNGSIHFSFFTNFDHVTLHSNGRTQAFRFDIPAHVQEPFILDVIKYFRGEGPNPCSIAEAATGMDIMEKLLGRY
ncbi:MAG TPA: Gfo/Idh/MocA family oxidoreductase [Chitinophaga sp.]|uniref:Gfo/Idh/MocA family protein n=1 Tax=Chitinophaga sp. TaxID=1869181 RepID=UPI002B585AED|nr:Gfo/Idh/MocA family oxidoreductase [Chitinophaga sp.]HVI46157.1 Gfo/Idh/MocA family oxidoreductase [Chitinophaga sp.]